MKTNHDFSLGGEDLGPSVEERDVIRIVGGGAKVELRKCS
jgi:hypothetical protein